MRKLLMMFLVLLLVVGAAWLLWPRTPPAAQPYSVEVKSMAAAGPHDGYWIFIDWASMPDVRYSIIVPAPDQLASCRIRFDGTEVAGHTGPATGSIGGRLSVPAAKPAIAEVEITDRAGKTLTWRHDFKSGFTTYPPL